MSRILSQIEEKFEDKKKNTLMEFVDGERFDELLGNVTKGLFRIIMFAGVPYFFYILYQSLFI